MVGKCVKDGRSVSLKISISKIIQQAKAYPRR